MISVLGLRALGMLLHCLADAPVALKLATRALRMTYGSQCILCVWGLIRAMFPSATMSSDTSWASADYLVATWRAHKLQN